MKISYDKEADALYIQFSDAQFSRNRNIDDLTILDEDELGNVIGIELLSASKRIPVTKIKKVDLENLPAI